MECLIGVDDEPDRRVIRLAGRLSSAQVPDLARACANTGGRSLSIDVSDLLNADAIGIEALRRLQREGIVLVGVPEYIRMKLHPIA